MKIRVHSDRLEIPGRFHVVGGLVHVDGKVSGQLVSLLLAGEAMCHFQPRLWGEVRWLLLQISLGLLSERLLHHSNRRTVLVVNSPVGQIRPWFRLLVVGLRLLVSEERVEASFLIRVHLSQIADGQTILHRSGIGLILFNV